MENNNSSLFNLREYDLMFNDSRNMIVVVIIIMAIVVVLLFFSNLGNNSNLSEGENTNNYVGLIMTILLIVFVILCVKYYYDNVLNIKEKSRPPPQSPRWQKKEVFNIPGNIYNYKEAEELCKAYDSRLANYEEVEKAYNEGAEWCNYGWSDEQMAYFPTQQKTFDNLQKIAGHENDCGRAGINGGYMANPQLKFGVNCYGYKPKITPEEEHLMSSTTPYPQTQKDIDFQNEIDYWKTQITNILVSPFNYKNWSRI